jgi:hypothetical protein
LCLTAAIPLAAQPKLLVNAKMETASAAAGLERAFRPLVSAQPQPAWVAYDAPLLPGIRLGCELVSPNGWWAPGTVHLEPPDRMVVLIRVESNAVERVRALSPDCQIDLGGLPLHWLTDVKPAESVALLASITVGASRSGDGFVNVIALHADPAATAVLIRSAREDAKPEVRSQAVSALARRPEPAAIETITAVIQNDSDLQVKRRAVSALQSLPDNRGVPLLIQIARTGPNPDVRKQAVTFLSQSRDARALSFLEDLIKK